MNPILKVNLNNYAFNLATEILSNASNIKYDYCSILKIEIEDEIIRLLRLLAIYAILKFLVIISYYFI